MAGWGFNIGLDGRNMGPLTEREAEEIAGGLAEIYSQARETMLKQVSNRMRRGVTGPGWAERKAAEVLDAHHQLERIYDRAARQRDDLLKDVVYRAMASGNEKFYTDMKAILGNVQHISPNSAKAAYILADLNNTLDAAHRRILRQFDDRYADVIGTAAAKMATGVTNTRQAVGEALTAFADNGVDCFIDRGGHHWTMENYSEMAVLTAIERSTISGYVDTMQSYDYDLALIDGHAGSCPICAAWEGVIVSVSGDNPDYPSLGDAENDGCFHPRCLHGITTYYPGITHEPRGGFRNEPREREEPEPSYTARSKQRYMERQIRKYKDRAIVAQTPEQLRQARLRVQQWQDALDDLIEAQPDDNYMYRQRGREKARALSWRNYKTEISSTLPANLTPDQEVQALVTDTIDRIMKDWPALNDHLQSVVYAIDKEGAFGAARTDGKVIRLDGGHFSNLKMLKRLFLESVASGDTRNATDPMFVVAHECGHCLESMIAMKRIGITEIGSVFDHALVSEEIHKMWVEYYQHMGFSNKMTYDEIQSIIEDETGIIGANNASEMLAQSFALQYYGTGKHEHADALIDYLKTMLR